MCSKEREGEIRRGLDVHFREIALDLETAAVEEEKLIRVRKACDDGELAKNVKSCPSALSNARSSSRALVPPISSSASTSGFMALMLSRIFALASGDLACGREAV